MRYLLQRITKSSEKKSERIRGGSAAYGRNHPIASHREPSAAVGLMISEGDEKARIVLAVHGVRWHAMDCRRSVDLYHISAKQKLGKRKQTRKYACILCGSADGWFIIGTHGIVLGSSVSITVSEAS